MQEKDLRETYVSAKLLKMLLAAAAALTPFVFDKMLLFEREPIVIEMGDDANEIGPPTSIGGESAFGGLFPEFCDVLKSGKTSHVHNDVRKQVEVTNYLIHALITYRNPGDGEPALPEHDCDTD